MKQNDPTTRFRLEKAGISRHTVETAEVGERGLEAPDEFWVELSVYEADPSLPPVDPSEYVYEMDDGVLKPGVTWAYNFIYDFGFHLSLSIIFKLVSTTWVFDFMCVLFYICCFFGYLYVYYIVVGFLFVQWVKASIKV